MSLPASVESAVIHCDEKPTGNGQSIISVFSQLFYKLDPTGIALQLHTKLSVCLCYTGMPAAAMVTKRYVTQSPDRGTGLLALGGSLFTLADL